MSTLTYNPIAPNPVKVCIAHTRPVTHLQYSNIVDGSYWIVSSCKDGKPMLRNGETGDWVGTFEGHKGAVWSSCFDHTATRVATASADFTAKVWSSLEGTELCTFAHNSIVKTVAFAPDAHQLATGGMEKNVRIFDLQSNNAQPIANLQGHTDAIQTVLYINENTLISTARDKKLQVWDIRSSSAVNSVQLSDVCSSMEMTPQGIVCSVAKRVVVIDTEKYDIKHSVECEMEVESSSLHRNGDLCVIGGGDNWVRVVNFHTGQTLESLKGHHGPVHTIQYSPDFSSFASGSEDGTVRIWSTAVVKPEANTNGSTTDQTTTQAL